MLKKAPQARAAMERSMIAFPQSNKMPVPFGTF
jgi:hypothetical protein